MFDVIAFDADDTLWHNEPHYRDMQQKVSAMLAQYHEPAWVTQRLYETEIRNLEHYGYGTKGFTLSLIETAIELTEGRISGGEIAQIIALTKAMLCAPIELLDGVRETIEQLADQHELMVITKGDLFDQEAKLARSGLGDYFRHIEIVPDKTAAIYAAITKRHRLDPQRFLMVGNSLKSDVLPVLALGGHAVYIPYQTTWAHEQVPEAELADKHFHELAHIGALPAWLNEWKKACQ
ncbi:MAG: HAD family hydrolase [Acidobacteria bacterium]|nr:HAD family hydrolase [Acidobacteriota bacterium]